jgi:hypothetical protein
MNLTPYPSASPPFLHCQLLDHVEDPMLGPFPSATAAGPGVTERGKGVPLDDLCL